MNESQWLDSTDLNMLIFGVAARVPPRKLLLFASACARRAWGLVMTESPEASPDRLEAIAEDEPAEEQLASVRPIIAVGLALAQAVDDLKGSSHTQGYCPIPTLCGAIAELAAVVRKATATVRARCSRTFHTMQAREQAFQIDLLRDIVGNPFRTPRVNPDWLRVHDGLVRQMAQVIDDERDFGRVSVLGDALEDVGCTDDVLLSHCRGAGPHALGCWVVDLLLGK